ncbi:unnamed protein product [Dovyalis caffra]|uniref:Uncharacterized protein n=1 Tax=Dovyalis caffra TaxID=77055 RepID=A0AAV1S5C4_9ROSI|nr:unnamed protein product [Dovyalis caffra]
MKKGNIVGHLLIADPACQLLDFLEVYTKYNFHCRIDLKLETDPFQYRCTLTDLKSTGSVGSIVLYGQVALARYR